MTRPNTPYRCYKTLPMFYNVRFTGYVGRKASEGLRKLGKQQLYYKDLNLSLNLERYL
jgi:hypothetical protein